MNTEPTLKRFKHNTIIAGQRGRVLSIKSGEVFCAPIQPHPCEVPVKI